MLLKKIFMTVTFMLFLFSGTAYSEYSDTNYTDTSMRYDDLDSQQRNEVNSSFTPGQPTYDQPENENNTDNQISSYHHAKKHIHHSEETIDTDEIDNNSYDLPKIIATNEKVIIVDPKVHAWGAYTSDGKLIRSGLATAGSRWCEDIGRPCKTRSGSFRIYSLGSEDCYSSKYPVGEGGAPMPYCMYFNGAQGLHGSHEVIAGNISHGCVRLHVDDARWIRFNFASVGTKVIIKEY